MRVVAEVTGRTLVLPGGARYQVGERIGLDSTNEQHREVLDNGWARRIDPAPAKPIDSAPPVDKMIDSAPVRKAPAHQPLPSKKAKQR